MEIIVHHEPPVGFLDFAQEILEGVGCEILIIGAHLDFMTEGHMSVLILEKKCVVIDLAACAKDTRWMHRGAFYVPNVWFNLLYSIFHEAAHLYQIEEYGDGIHEVREEILEHSADLIAMDSLAEWIQETNNIVPKLEDFGWIKTMIKETINYMYAEGLPEIEIELDALQTDAVARALAVQDVEVEDGDSQEIASLLTDLGEKEDWSATTKVGDTLCLTTYGFLTLAHKPFAKEVA